MNKKLKGMRVSKGLLQTDMAKILNIGISTYICKENGKREFTLEEIYKLMNYFNCEFEDLFMDKKELEEVI